MRNDKERPCFGGKPARRNPLRLVLILLSLSVLTYSCARLGTYAYGIRTSEEAVRQLRALTEADPPELPLLMEEARAHGEESGDDIKDKLRAAMLAKYGSLKEQNPDFAGWLTIEGTNVDHPVMYTPDDPQYYLHRAFDGSYSLSGTLFIDPRCSMDPDSMSTNTIIYGHRMSSGTMFGSFGLFLENSDGYVRDHRKVRFDTPDRPGSYTIFAVFLTRIYEEDDTASFHYLDMTDAGSAEELEEYLSNIKAIASYYDEENKPRYGDEFLTLSTCSYHTEDGRLVILAKRTGY